MGDLWSAITDWTKKVETTIDPALNTYNKINKVVAGSQSSPSQPSQPLVINQNSPIPQPPSSTGGMSTGVKIALGVVGLGLVAGTIYVLTGDGKGLNGGSSGSADNNMATSTVFNGPKKSKKSKK